MIDDPTKDAARFIDDDGIARLPADDFRRILARAERGQALDVKTRDRVQQLVNRARNIDGELQREQHRRRHDPARQNALRMEAAGYRAEAMAIAILSL